ncbi:hypothetical protein AKJ53_00150 [candidate division MSBL1 archaeon SCGC-AAA382F02]|uniref:Putative nitroreductase TM1586 domain-containing protein n=1 Tax=candidate division MSBL1 archaeon SCGC-AAA382F02 TaxID=1698282 RepID=A0A133VJC8_9EURY|nr:hypothetical protein AKJ53_00150 [candidate division MSBL1 archaeon SCGC-AAA382F02]
MDVEKAILKRRSVRSYKEKKIPQEKLEEIINFGKMAPSANNRQDWKFILITDEKKKEEIYKDAKKQSFIKEASAIIAGITTNPEDKMTCGIPAGIVDLSIALDHISLKAAEEGLGTCWIGAFHQEKAKNTLEIPENHKIVALMTIGYPKHSLSEKEKQRKNLKEIISYNTFSE